MMERTEPEDDVAFGRVDTRDRGFAGAQPFPSYEHLRSVSLDHPTGARGRYPARLLRFVAGWAALGVVLTSATQLRPAAVPIGPGELLLVGWILFVGLLLLRGLRFTSGPEFRVLAAYWVASGALLGFGMLMALRMSVPISPRDAFAHFFMAVLSCLLALRLADDRGDHHARLAYLTLFMVAIVVTVLLALTAIAPGLGPISLWWGPRFRGWAENPNQLALLLVGMPFLGLCLLSRSRGVWRKIAYGLAIACCIWAGLATQADALRLAWAAGLGGIGALVWYRTVLRSRGAVMYLSHLVVPIVVVTLGYVYGPELVDRAQRTAQETYEQTGQGELRLTLWSNGIEAIALSPLVGFGPGSHSGKYGPLEGKEAHNSFIDWGTSTGTVGVILHLSLLIWGAWRAIRSGSFALLGLVVALAAFSLFNYTFRQPIYWLLLVLILALTAERRSRAAEAQGAAAPPLGPRP